jgi:hypothetical protein
MRRSFFLALFVLQLSGLAALADMDAFIPPRFKGIILSAPVPPYPGGVFYKPGMNGVYRLKINQQTGAVAEVSSLKRPSQFRLHGTTVLMLFKWKFKAGTIRQLDVPVEFDHDAIRPELKNAIVR